MNQEQTQVGILKKSEVKPIVWFLGLVLVAVVVPHFVHNQFITGSIINATLFLAAFELGSGAAVLVGLLPSVAALVSGLLPAALAPMIPFIMISNAILILVFKSFSKINSKFGIVIASLTKYLFLYAASSWMYQLIVQKPLASKAVLTMVQWPQLVTALAGGIIALIAISVIKKNESNQQSQN